MNFRKLILLVLIVSLLSACQKTQATEQPKAPADTAYPAPVVPIMGAPDSLYPAYGNGAQVSWNQARGLILNGEVQKITAVAQTLMVTLSIKDGRSLLAQQPAPGELDKVLQECGEACKGIEVVNE